MQHSIVKPVEVSGTFYELPQAQTEIFTRLFADGYREELRRVAVLGYPERRYIAAADGYIAIYYSCDDSMPIGDYKGLPYMRLDDGNKMQRNLSRILKEAEELATYEPAILPDWDEDSEEYDYQSRASLAGVPCFVGRIDDNKFIITDAPPTSWVLDANKVKFIMNNCGGVKKIKAGKPNQNVVFYHYNGAISILMPMRTSHHNDVVFKR